MDSLDFRTGGPIYTKLKESLRAHIISGVYAADERMPSVRELALSLSVNPNTIVRAYRALEEEGYVYTVPGKGSFARPPADIDSKRRERLLEGFSAVARELFFLGTPSEKLHELIDKEFAEND